MIVTEHAATVSAPRTLTQAAPTELGAAAIALCCGGLVLTSLVLPPLHLALFAANGLVAYWLSRRSWTWIRKYHIVLSHREPVFLRHVPRPEAGL